MITYNEIIKCHSCDLRQLFAKKYRNSNKYHSFTFYYEPKDAKKSKYIIVMQNPGLPKNWKNSEEYQALSRIEGHGFISTSKKYLIQWLRKENANFCKDFFAVLRKYGLIQFDDFDEYLENNFLSDFIVTDLVKCRAGTEEINSENIKICSNRFLYNEIEHYGKNRLIFAFSSRTWEFLYSKFIVGGVLSIGV